MTWTKIESSVGADVWNFETQPEMEGEFIRKEEKIGPNNSNMYYFTIENEEIGVWGNTVLDNRLVDFKAGTKTKIVYLGKVKTKRGTEYKNFDVFTDSEPLPF